MAETIGVLHPGAMGTSIAAAARGCGHRVAWLRTGRSKASAERAEANDLLPVGSMLELSERCSIILSVCPPEAAVAVTEAVLAAGFQGLYVDGNAISPAKARHIAGLISEGGADYVDGGIVGPPAWKPGTCLYLSGQRSDEVERLFRGSPLEVSVLGDGTDTASALKMCYAARTKGMTALMATILAAADALDVRDHLAARWAQEDSGLPGRIESSVQRAAPKAWRWIYEMNEIAATLREAGAEGGFHDAASALYERLSAYKDADPPPDLEAIFASLRETDGSGKNSDEA